MIKQLLKDLNAELNVININMNEIAQMSPVMRLVVRGYYRNKFINQVIQQTMNECIEHIGKQELSADDTGKIAVLMTRFSAMMEISDGTEKGLVSGIFFPEGMKNHMEKEEAAKAKIQ